MKSNMPIRTPFNLKRWVATNQHLLKPPVCNHQLFLESNDYIVMIIGGPNKRKDYHYNETEEIFYQLSGDITLKIIQDNKFLEIPIKEGEIFFLPPKIPHSTQRPAETVGLVVETSRKKSQKDGLIWFCENCRKKLYEEYIHVSDMVKQLPIIIRNFTNSKKHRTCKNCGTIMEMFNF